jgi:CRP-like cAMP-binding protein
LFYAVRSGAVGLELASPTQSPLVIETLHEGDVLGWSWLFPPYRVRYDARAIGEVHAIAFDGACLRGKCDDDHDLGYELMRRFAQVITERLQATRIRLLDVYGAPASVRT